MEIQIGQLRSLYLAACNRELGNNPVATLARVGIIQLLENATKQSFKNTRDFHQKVGQFFIKNSDTNAIVQVPTFCERSTLQHTLRDKFKHKKAKDIKSVKKILPQNEELED